MNVMKVCEECLQSFKPHAHNQKFCCEECAKEAARKQRKQQNVSGVDLDSILDQCRKQGITYAEWQRKQTTAMYARVEV